MSKQTEIVFQFPKQFRIGEEYRHEKIDETVNDFFTLDGEKFATTTYFSTEYAIDLFLLSHDDAGEIFTVETDPMYLMGALRFVTESDCWLDLQNKLSDQNDEFAKKIARLERENQTLREGLKSSANISVSKG